MRAMLPRRRRRLGTPGRGEGDADRDYWDESVHYVFSMDEVLSLEADVEVLHSMCLAAVDHVVSTSLGNASGGISIGLGDVLLHTVGWALAQKAGKSAALDPDAKLDPMNTSADGPPWCTSVDAGTPKQENPQCP